MRIAYMSTDEVNQALAAGLAANYGTVVCSQHPKDPPPDGRFDAVLYNLDDVPRDQRPALLAGFRRGKPDHPTAVHGYDIIDEQARTLKRNGVPAARRLHSALLRSLFTAARKNRETVPQDDSRTALTWVNLANCAQDRNAGPGVGAACQLTQSSGERRRSNALSSVCL